MTIDLATAKSYLGVTDDAEDSAITRLLTAARTYLTEIGVTTDPEPEPVGEAILLIVGRLYHHAGSGAPIREETVEGVGSRVFADPQRLDDATRAFVERLAAPYREVAL